MDINKGLDLINRPLDKEHGAWNDAQNIVVTDGLKSVRNERGCSLVFSNVTLPYIHGVISTATDVVYFSIDDINPQGHIYGEIGLFRNGIYTTIIRSRYLGFKKENPIQGVGSYTPLGELVVTWNDGVNDTSTTPKILNIDNPQLDLTISYEFVNPTDVVKLELFSQVNVPYLTSYKIDDSGGTVESGAYYFFISYKIDTYTSTPYLVSLQPIHIGDLQNNSPTNVIGIKQTISQKDKPGDTTSKVINFEVRNLDIRYSSFNLGIIKQINEIKTAHFVGEFNINNSTQSIRFDGNVEDDLSLDTLLIPHASFDKVDGFTINNDSLIAANVTQHNVNYQKYANGIKTEYELIVKDNSQGNGGNYGDINRSSLTLSFEPNEVIALYAHLVYTNGTIGEGFHIPGRDVISGEPNPRLILTDPTDIAIAGNDGKYFQLYDTSLKIGQYGVTRNLLGFWENEDELYPNTSDFDIFGSSDTLRNKKVRHHKIPSIYNFDNIGIISGIFQRKKLSWITIHFSNIHIPAEYQNVIQGVVFSYAKRTFQNSTIIGEGLAIINSDISVLPAVPHASIRFYNNALLNKKPIISNVSYIRRTTSNYSSNIYYAITSITDIVASITNINYVDKNISATTPNNTDREEYIQVHTSLSNVNLFSSDNNTRNNIQLCTYVKNCYNSFYEQELILGNTFITKEEILLGNNNTKLLNRPLYGDVYLTTHISQREGLIYGITVFYNVYAFSPLNGNFIQQGTSPFTVKYDPFLYSFDYSAINNIKSPSPYNPNLVYNNRFPRRIYKTIKQNKEDLFISWRTFLIDEYYEMPLTKKEIIGVASDGRTLYIQHRDTLYATSIKDVLRTQNDIEAYLGQVDIFEREPVEIITDKDGVIGCDSRYGFIITPLGYVVVDRKQQAIWLVNETKAVDLTTNLAKEFFEVRLDTTKSLALFNRDIDNPFFGVGITLVYDKRYERLIVCKRDYTSNVDSRPISIYNPHNHIPVNLTMSYSFKLNKWICKHTYHPNYIFSNRDGIYAIINTNNPNAINSETNVFKHNNKNNKGLYYNCHTSNPIPDKSYVDIIFNVHPTVDKILESVNWLVDTLINDVVNDDYTIDEIMVYNDKQCSGLLPVNKMSSWFNSEYGRNINGQWFYNNFKDYVINDNLPFLDEHGTPIQSNINKNLKNWFDFSLFNSKFVIIRLSTNNPFINDMQPTITFLNVSIEIKKSIR